MGILELILIKLIKIRNPFFLLNTHSIPSIPFKSITFARKNMLYNL